MATKKTNIVKKTLAVGGAIAGLSAIAGAYFLFGTKEGAKKRKAIKGWALKAKGEVLEKIEQAKDLTEDKYMSLIDSAMGKYYKLKDKYGDDVDLLASELKSYWKTMQKSSSVKSKKVSKAPTKTK